MPGEQKKVCIDVPYIDQSKLYPTGCESVSTVMLLRFLGIDITVDEFIEKYLEKKSFEAVSYTHLTLPTICSV